MAFKKAKLFSVILTILALGALFSLPQTGSAAVGTDCAVACPQFQYCRDGGLERPNDFCAPLLGIGVACDSSAECFSENCQNGVCTINNALPQPEPAAQDNAVPVADEEAENRGAGGGGGFFSLPPLIPAACTRGAATTEECGLRELVQVGINFARIILALSGSLALIMFIFGGFTWLTAAGSSERVDKGKKILIGAVIGLIIIFGAVTIINFAEKALKTPTSTQQNR